MGKFNVLWIDDQPEKCKKDQIGLKKSIETQGLIPNIKLINKVRKDQLLQEGHPSYKELTSREYDLLIIDYKLSSDLLGDEVISEVRTKYNIYTDIIFYSSAKDELIQSVKKSFDEPSSLSYLDDVYIVPLGDDFNEKINRIINKIVASWYNAHSIRGVILSKVSYFETLVSEIIRLYYKEMEDELKLELSKKGKNIVQSTVGRWNALEKNDDTIIHVLENPQSFNWAVKNVMFTSLINNGIITLPDSIQVKIKEIFNLRNDFAHNVVKIENGSCFLYKDGKKISYDTEKIKEIRNDITSIEKALKNIIDRI